MKTEKEVEKQLDEAIEEYANGDDRSDAKEVEIAVLRWVLER